MTTNTNTESSIEFKNHDLFNRICGVADSGISKLEKMLDVSIVPRGHSFILQSNDDLKIQQAHNFFNSLQTRYQLNGPNLPEDFDLLYLFKQIQKNTESRSEDRQIDSPPIISEFNKELILINSQGYKITPRTLRQAEFVQSIADNDITICTGPAGTGKTFLSTAVACRLFQKGKIERIVLTRPAVEAGESLGFLPGDLNQKVDPYLRPLYDALYECLGNEKVHDLIDLRKIEIAPLAYMRGRTLNDSFVILDEAQNCTLSQLKMFMTRLGRNSRMCIGGDITQIDLDPGKSGLDSCTHILTDVKGIGVVEFGSEDIIRHPLVERIVRAFKKHGA